MKTTTSSLFLDHSSQRKLVSKVMQVIMPLLLLFIMSGILFNVFGVFHYRRFILNIIGLVMVSIAWVIWKQGRVVTSIQIILYTALILFGASVLVNGGVKTPNYVGFLAISVLASIFSKTRVIWVSYIGFMFIGAATLIYPFYVPEEITYPPDHRYYTIYGVLGLVISLCLVFTREAFNGVVKRLAERESLLSSVFEAITDPLLVFDAKQQLTYRNQSAETLNQRLELSESCTLEEMILFDLLSKQECSLSELVFKSSVDTETITYKTHTTFEQKTTWFSISVSPYNSSLLNDGKLVVIRDITEQQRLTQAQKMQAVGRLANGVAHDFNNMLGAIKSANDLLMLDLDEEHHDLLEMIAEATDRSAKLIRQLRLFSKRNDSEEAVINLNELISDVKVMLQSVSQHSHQVQIQCDEKVILFKGIREQLHSMLMNLGLNGLQAMGEQGDLIIGLRVQRNQDDHDASIIIEVIDQGHGISPDLQEKIFEPFFTTRKRGEGIGLGLSIAHGAVQRHQGLVEVVSILGQGTTMKVILPYDASLMISHAEPETNIKLNSLAGLSVLIIDDEALIRQSLAAMLKSLGVRVSLAANGDVGLQMVREQISRTQGPNLSSPNTHYDLIILDMLMPGKNGHEVFNELQVFASSIPVILSSGYYPEDALEDMNKQGLAGQLHKPYGLNEVHTMLSKVMHQES